MSDADLRELERRYNEQGRLASDALAWYAALERAGQREIALWDANGRLKQNRDERATIDYLLRTEPLAFTGWALHGGLDVLYIIDGQETHRHELSRLYGEGTRVENLAFCDGLLYVIDEEGRQHTIPAHPAHTGLRTPDSFSTLADHANRRVLYSRWTQERGTRHVTREGEVVSGIPAHADYVSPTKTIRWEAEIAQTQPNRTRVIETPGEEIVTEHPYLIENGKLWHVPTDGSGYAFRQGNTTTPSEPLLLAHPGSPRIPWDSRIYGRQNIVSSPYDLGILVNAGNVSAVEVDLRVLEALRAVRGAR